MARYVASRLLSLLPILFGVSVVTFLLMRLVPGDPVIAMLGLEADQAAISAMRLRLALDDPLPLQYLHWISRVLTGDFGRSVQGGREVLPLLLGALGPVQITK
jgi:peptide/nickel transport system permease protein